MLEFFLFQYFFSKFHMYFSMSNSIGHILGLVGQIEIKQKGNALFDYWVNYVTLISDLIFDLDFGFFQVKFEIAVSGELFVWLMWNKKNQINRILHQLCDLAVWLYPWLLCNYVGAGGCIVIRVTSDISVLSTYVVLQDISDISLGRHLSHQLLKSAWKLLIYNSLESARGQWVNPLFPWRCGGTLKCLIDNLM